MPQLAGKASPAGPHHRGHQHRHGRAVGRREAGGGGHCQPASGVEYKLDVLAENIEDDPHNLTRFVVIGGQVPDRTGDDRTAILFQMEHRPGTLADALNIFKRSRLNLTWIESFPLPGSDRATCSSSRWPRMPSIGDFGTLTVLKRKALRLEVLGAVPSRRPSMREIADGHTG